MGIGFLRTRGLDEQEKENGQSPAHIPNFMHM
jgi:hypothetical protein